MRAIVVREYGPPDVMKIEEVANPVPKPGECLVHHRNIGVNFVDTQHRAGAPYEVWLPITPGIEAAGVIEAVGEGVTEFRPGDRVGYTAMVNVYAEKAAVPVDRLVALPDSISFETAAGVLLQGMTAHYLCHDAYHVKKGDTVLIHAAAGGVGLLLVQMAKRCGAAVIGTVSTPEKFEAARQAGADHVIPCAWADFVKETQRITEGKGVDVVYDGIGKDTFEGGLRVLRACGHMVLYGLASGPVPPFNPHRLSGHDRNFARGSLHVTWPSLGDYTATRAQLMGRAGDLFKWIADGSLRLRIAAKFPLAEAPRAHEMLMSRSTIGKIILTA